MIKRIAKQTADTSSGMISRLAVVVLIFLLTSQFLVAQTWYDSHWSYRSPITVSNPVAGTLTNLQVKITLTTGNFDFTKPNSNGSDIRLTGSDGVTPIPFWIESWVSGSSANIWVKIPSIPVAGTTVFIYFGNSDATTSLSSGISTFEFFDDFESWTITPHPSVWQDQASIPTPSADLTISVYNNKLYSFGGYGNIVDGVHENLNTVYEFDPATNLWTSKSPMPTPRWGMVSVEVGGKIYVFGGSQAPTGTEFASNEIYDPINNTWESSNNGNPLSLPRYEPYSTGVTHPDVIYFPGGRDGYQYWMAYTPYPSETEENPSILRSNDGINWVSDGTTNPVIPGGTDGAWNDQENPDPDFIYVADYNKWFMIWDGGDVATNSRKIALAYSDDGKNWTQYDGELVNGNANPVIISGTDDNGASWERLNTDPPVSKTSTSSLFYQEGTFYLFYAEEASGNNRGKIGLATFTWNNVNNDVVGFTRIAGNPIIDLPADAVFKSGGSHIDVCKNQGSNTYRMYVVRQLASSPDYLPNFELSLLTSSSLTGGWTSQGKVIERGAIGQWDEDQIYRSCPVVNNSGEIVLFDNKIRIYYSGVGSQGWRIGIADIDQTSGSVVKYTGGGPQPMPSGIAHQGLMGVKYLDKIHLFYGSYHYEYDPVLDTYTRKADVPNSRNWGTCAVVGSRIYLIGGFNLGGGGGGTNDNQVYNPVNDTWEQKAPMPVSRYGATRENPVIGGKIYVTHGWNNDYFFTCNYVYDPVTDTWELKGSANHPRDGVACGVINNKLYVVGGRDVPSATYGINWNEVYDPAADTWTPQADPSGWATSGSNYAFADGTAAYPGSYSGNHGLVVRQPMDGSAFNDPGFRFAETVQDFGTIYALDFDWNVTTLGGTSEGYPINPHGIVRLNSNSDWYGNLIFIQSNGSPTLQWIYNHRGTLQSGLTWDNWHKVTFICESPARNWVVFDGTQYSSVDIPMDPDPIIHYSPLPTAPWGTGNIRFGVIRTTEYLDNVRVRKWAGSDPVTLVGIEQNGTLNHWTGASSSDWETPGNWSSGSVPTPSSNIAIFNASNIPVITSTQSVSCNNLTIEPSARLTIETGGTLAVSGTLTINSVGAANSGSLVVNGTITTSGPVTYNRYMPLGSEWHYVSTPVNLNADPSGSFWAWDEVAGDWSSVTISRPTSGKGYTMRAFGNSVAFTGSLVASNISITATSPYSDPFDGLDYSTRPYANGRNSTTAYGGGGWNLLGNPFTAALNVSAFIDANYDPDWNLSKFDPNYVALYLYDGNSYKYVTKSGMGWESLANGDHLNETHIQVGQGFFVLAMNDQATFNFSPSMQGHNTIVSLLKSAKANYRWPGLQLKAKFGDTENLTTIVFNDNMTFGLDPGYDVGLMSSGSDIEIYTALVEDNGINFTLQALPENGSVKNVIPVGIDFEKGGKVTFSAEVEPFRNYKYWLEDRLTGMFTDLSANAYTVILPAKTYGTGRFFVYVAAGRSIQPRTNHANLLEIRIWASQKNQISIQGSVSDKATCEVFDTWGHKIFETRLTDGSLNTFIIPSVKNGVYLVRVTDGMKVVTQKVPLL